MSVIVKQPKVSITSDYGNTANVVFGGRLCYMSYPEFRVNKDKPAEFFIPDSSNNGTPYVDPKLMLEDPKFIRRIVKQQHYSVLGHSQVAATLSDYDAYTLFSTVPQHLRHTFTYVPHSESDNLMIVAAGFDAWLQAFKDNPGNRMIPYFYAEFPDVFYEFCEGAAPLYTLASLDNDDDIQLKYDKDADPCPAFETKIASSITVDDAMLVMKESVFFQVSRAAAMQLRTYRNAAHSVMSQRYVDFSDGSKNVFFIQPSELDDDQHGKVVWAAIKWQELSGYQQLIDLGYKPEVARGAIGQDVWSPMLTTASLWEWRHILQVRLQPGAQTEVRAIAEELQQQLIDRYSEDFPEIAEKFINLYD